jgi:hypothetical protein
VFVKEFLSFFVISLSFKAFLAASLAFLAASKVA